MTVTYFTATNRQGRETCGTSALPPAELVAKLTAMGWTGIETSTRKAA